MQLYTVSGTVNTLPYVTKQDTRYCIFRVNFEKPVHNFIANSTKILGLYHKYLSGEIDRKIYVKAISYRCLLPTRLV